MIPYLLGSVALVAWLVMPGLVIGILAERRNPAPARARLALFAVTGGLCFWYLGSQIVVRLGAVSTPLVWLVTIAVAAGSVVVLRRFGPEVLARVQLPHLLPSATIGGIAAVIGALPVLRLIGGRDDTLLGSTPWYYWRLTQETVRAHGVPTWSWEWAMRLPFLDDYPAFTSASAVLAVASGDPTSLASARLVIVVVLVTFGLSVYLLARELGADRLPAAIAVVVMTSGATFSLKLLSFRPEGAGYALMLLVPAAAIDFFRTRRPSSLVLVAVAGLTLSQIHGLAWVFAMAVLAGLAVAAIVMARRPRASTVRATITITVVVAGAWLVGNAVLGGGLSGASKLGGLPHVGGGVDPTFEFRYLVNGHLEPPPEPSFFGMAMNSLRPDLLGGPDGAWLAGGVVVLGALVYTAIQRGDRRRAALRLVLVIGVTLVAVLAFSFWLSIRNATFVPRRTGFGRVLQLSFVMFPFALALVLSAIARRRKLVAGAIGLLVAGLAYFPAEHTLRSQASRTASAETLRELRDLDLPDDALVLTNFYSEGFVPDVTGGRGVIDGRAPYTEGSTLEKVNAEVRRAVEFFSSPTEAPDPPLPVDGITHVLVSTGDGWALGSSVRWATNQEMLDRRSDLHLVASSPVFRLYEVNR